MTHIDQAQMHDQQRRAVEPVRTTPTACDSKANLREAGSDRINKSKIQEVVDAIRELAANANGQGNVSGSILKLICSVDDTDSIPGCENAICQELEKIDSAWSIRLQIVGKSIAHRKRAFLQRLAKVIIEQAQKESEYPRDIKADDYAEHARKWLKSTIDRCSKQKTPPLALLLSALLGDRHREIFGELVIRLVAQATKEQNKVIQDDDISKLGVELIGKGGDKLKEAGVLLHYALANLSRADEERHRAEAAASVAAREREILRDQLREGERRIGELQVELAEQRARADTLAQELARARELAELREREARSQGIGELSRLRSYVHRVVVFEIGEIRRYLERAPADAAAALERLSHLEALAAELGAQD